MGPTTMILSSLARGWWVRGATRQCAAHQASRCALTSLAKLVVLIFMRWYSAFEAASCLTVAVEYSVLEYSSPSPALSTYSTVHINPGR